MKSLDTHDNLCKITNLYFGDILEITIQEITLPLMIQNYYKVF